MLMKKFSLIFLVISLFFISLLSAQSSFFFTNKEINNWYLEVKEEDKLAEIQKVITSDEINELVNKHNSNKDSLLPYFHFIDFDNDGLRDLLFNGKIGNKNYVLIYKKKTDGSYRFIFNQTGEIIQSNAPYQQNPLSFTIWNKNCCGYKVSILTKWVCISNNNTSYFLIQDKSLIYNNTLLPEMGTKKILLAAFTIKTEVAKLRLSPRLDDESLIEGINAWKGNHISLHPQGASGVIYHSLKDKDGTTWYFICIFTGKDHPTRTDRIKLSGEIEDCENYSYYGWIHGDNLHVITQ